MTNKNQPLVLLPVSMEDFESKLEQIVSDLFLKLKKAEIADRCLTVKETCDLLGGVSKVTIEQWAKKGWLKKYQVGKRVFYKYQEVIDALDKGDVYRHRRVAR